MLSYSAELTLPILLPRISISLFLLTLIGPIFFPARLISPSFAALSSSPFRVPYAAFVIKSAVPLILLLPFTAISMVFAIFACALKGEVSVLAACIITGCSCAAFSAPFITFACCSLFLLAI